MKMKSLIEETSLTRKFLNQPRWIGGDHRLILVFRRMCPDADVFQLRCVGITWRAAGLTDVLPSDHRDAQFISRYLHRHTAKQLDLRYRQQQGQRGQSLTTGF